MGFSTSNFGIFEEYVVILPAQALHHHGQRCLPAISRDFGLLGANFAGIGADFVRVYPRRLCKKGVAAPLPRAELTIIAIRHRVATVTFPQTKKPTPAVLDQSFSVPQGKCI